MLDITQTINENHSVETLFSEFELILNEELGVSKILLFSLDDGEWSIRLCSGVKRDIAEAIDVERDLLQIRKIENLTLTENASLQHFDAVIPLYHKYKITGYLLVGDNDDLLHGISPTVRNLKFIQIVANVIIVHIENHKMQSRLLRQESLRRELEIASEIQAGLVPSDNELLKTSYTNVRSLYHPHLEVGGDYFDVIRLSPYSVGFCIADVSGKGMGAALIMSNFQAMVRTLFTSSISMKRLITELNRKVYENTTDDKYITCFVARYNMLTGRLSYVNAGHLPPIVYNSRSGELGELERGCIGIGMLDSIPGVEVGSVRIKKGMKMIAFTDGLIEVDNGNRIDQCLGQLRDMLRTSKSINETMDMIERMAEEYRKEKLVFDDISVLGIEFVKDSLLALPI